MSRRHRYCGLLIDRLDLLARDRRPPIAEARKVAMYVAREVTGASYPAIGRAFDGRDHSTVMAAIRAAEADIAEDPAKAQRADALIAAAKPSAD